MATGYVIGEYKAIKREFPEFALAEQSLHDDVVSMALADWAPKTFGGFTPVGNQFGETTILPALFAGDPAPSVPGYVTLTTWNQILNVIGSRAILTGSHTSLIPEDFKVGLTGFLFADKVLRISELKMQVGDAKYVRVNIEEAQCYEKPAIVFEEGFLLDEKTGFDLHAYVVCRGQQRIVPLGFQLNRIPNKTQVTNCGAAVE